MIYEPRERGLTYRFEGTVGITDALLYAVLPERLFVKRIYRKLCNLYKRPIEIYIEMASNSCWKCKDGEVTKLE